MSENINITSRVGSPEKRCPEAKLYGKRLRKQLLPFLMPGHRTRGSGPTWAGKADPCFYLNGGNYHASDCDNMMLEFEIVSYTTNATYAYRRVPFVGQQVTFGNGSSALLCRRRPPRRWEGVEPAVWLVNRGKVTPSPLPLRHRPHLRRGGETSAFCEITRAAEGASGGHHPSFTVAGRTVDGRRHQRSTKSIGGVAQIGPPRHTGATGQPSLAVTASHRHPGRHQIGGASAAGRGRSARGVCSFIREGAHPCGNCNLGRAPFRQP